MKATIDPLAPLAGVDGTAPGTRPVPPAILRRAGLDLVLEYSDGMRFGLAAARDTREGVRGEVTVTDAGGRRLSWGALPLASVAAREGLRKKLETVAPGHPWAGYLEDAVWRFTRAIREGEPLAPLTGRATAPTRELVPGLLYEGEPTQVYGDGDTGKSLLSLVVAVAVHSGVPLPGLRPLRAVPAAVLDWETTRDTVEARLGLVAAGLGIDPPAVLYKRMVRPLADEAGALAAEFARRGVGLVVIDSKMFAVAGGDGGAFHEPITAFYGALRLFAPAASLVLNHVTNADARSGAPARPFGGAFAFNGPRLIWEAKRDPEITDATAMVLTCRKANNLPRRPDPFGLRFQQLDGALTISRFDLADATPQTVAGATLAQRVLLALSAGSLTTAELAEHLAGSEDTVGRVLRRLAKADRVVRLSGDATGGRGKETRWALRSLKADT